MLKIIIIGNPNVGKSSLFNTITNGNQKVANWPGKTIKCKNGICTVGTKKIQVVDLPGAYSLHPYSEDEKDAVDVLLSKQFDSVIQIIDCSNIERNLYLTLELLEITRKVVIALNMTDIADKEGLCVDVDGLSNTLGVPVVKIDARSGYNVDKLFLKAIEIAEKKETVSNFQHVNQTTKYQKKSSNDPQKRYEYISSVLSKFITRTEKNDNFKMNSFIDSLAVHPIFGFILFFGLMYLIFNMVFLISKPFSDAITILISWLSEFFSLYFERSNMPEWVESLVLRGILGGFGSILIFLPPITIMLFFLYFIEDSGYLARTVVISDWFLKKFGLGGKVFIPILLGFGCNVPAIISTKIIKEKSDKLLAILSIPYMSCSARFPVYVLFAATFFPGNEANVILFLYILGIIVGLFTAYIMKKIILKKSDTELIIELPKYQVPYIGNLILETKESVMHFLQRAGSVILVASIFTWFLASMPYGIDYGSEYSYAGQIGKAIANLFLPLGFNSWQTGLAIFNGVIAKEIVISTFATTYSVDVNELQNVISSSFTRGSALAFMVFVLLYLPCVATFSALYQESGSLKIAIAYSLYSIIIAYILALLTYNVAILIGL